MGKTVAKIFGAKTTSGVDTSAYDKQIAEQKAATEKAEADAAKLKADQDAAEERRRQGRSSLIRTSAAGDTDLSSVKRKSLLGG